MTQAESVPIEHYDGNDSATAFSFNHYIKTDDELVITHKTTAGVVTIPVLDTDYTVTGEGTAAVTITFPKAGSSYSTLASGSPAERLTAKRDTDQDRTVDMSGAYQFTTLNNDGDKLVRMVQDLAEKVGRAALQTISNSGTVPTLEAVIAGIAGLNLANLDGKATPVDGDATHIVDSEAANLDKKMLLSDLWANYLAAKVAALGYLTDVVLDTTPQLGGDLDANGNNILFDDATGIRDDSDNELIRFQKTADAINHLDITNAAIGNDPIIEATGDDTDVGLLVKTKGAGQTEFDHTACFTIVDNGNSGAAKTIDWRNGNKQKITLTDDCTFTFTAPQAGTSLLLEIVQDGTGSRLVTWPGSLKWPSGLPPTLTTTLTTGTDVIAFYYNGSNYLCAATLDLQTPP